jgi:NAD(P)-dependent dehydrogenase (short-subunit alcohol dehydrogenase family)
MGMLANKIILVTGAGSGIGRASSIGMAQEDAKVIVVDMNSEGGDETVNIIKNQGGDAIFIQTDVTKSSDVTSMVEDSLKKFGSIDVLYNNVGGWRIDSNDSVTENSEEEWDHLINLNLKSVYLVSRQVIPHMIERGGGSIINTITTNAYMTYPKVDGYSAAKAGVMELTKAMALTYAKNNIRVNGVVPGETLTPQWKRTYYSLPNKDEAIENMRKMIPLGRFAEPEDIAEMVIWLASDKSRYATGAIFVVDGGLTAGFYS